MFVSLSMILKLNQKDYQRAEQLISTSKKFTVPAVGNYSSYKIAPFDVAYTKWGYFQHPIQLTSSEKTPTTIQTNIWVIPSFPK